jgi:hypothetical protein
MKEGHTMNLCGFARVLTTLCFVAIPTIGAGRDMSDFFPRAESFIPVAPPYKFLVVFHAFHASTQDLNPSPLVDNGRGEDLLIALRAIPTPYGFGAPHLGRNNNI